MVIGHTNVRKLDIKSTTTHTHTWAHQRSLASNQVSQHTHVHGHTNLSLTPYTHIHGHTNVSLTPHTCTWAYQRSYTSITSHTHVMDSCSRLQFWTDLIFIRYRMATFAHAFLIFGSTRTVGHLLLYPRSACQRTYGVWYMRDVNMIMAGRWQTPSGQCMRDLLVLLDSNYRIYSIVYFFDLFDIRLIIDALYVAE